MGYFCDECGETISDEVYDFSKKRFSRPLCREHQPRTIKSNRKKPEPTLQAQKLGKLLMGLGHKVEFEKYDGYKHIDIAIVEAKVNIEVDGTQHHTTEQALRDLKRTFYSWNKDFVTLRIPNSLTRDDVIEETAEYIDKFIKKDRVQLEKEIREEYLEEGNPFWEDINNIISNARNAINNFSNSLGDKLKSFKI